MHILGPKVQHFSGGGPPDPPLIGRLRLLFRRLAKIPAENPEYGLHTLHNRILISKDTISIQQQNDFKIKGFSV